MRSASTQPKRIRLRVTAAAEKAVRGGHPWLFAESIREQNQPGAAGDLAVIYDRQDKLLAVGLYDPLSPIRVRVLHAGKPQPVDSAFWEQRLAKAIQRRSGLFEATTNGYRCIHGESDGWPGLVLDRYADTLVLKLYTSAWFSRLGEILELIAGKLAPRNIVLRLSRNILEQAKAHGLKDGSTVFGPEIPANPVVFQETGLQFEADVLRGQKTGFFLDQRENRRKVETLAAGRRVLNAFSFSGGFSLYAARGEAQSVTDLDISPHALEAARRNFALNAAVPGVARCRHESVQADAFEWFAQGVAARFDLIILDPPSLARRESERAGALTAYKRLASSAIERLAPSGILLACSCSAHVSADEFFTAVRKCAVAAARKHRELETTLHPLDHPAAFKEAEYLKAIYLEFA